MAVAGGFRSSFALDTSSFMAGINQARAAYERRAKQAINLGVMLFEREVKKELSKPGTGRLYKRRRRRGRGQFHRASAPGQPPAVDMGVLRSSITHFIERELLAWVGQVGTGLKDTKGRPIGAHLEFGTSRMAARPFMLTTLERIRPQLLVIFATTLGG